MWKLEGICMHHKCGPSALHMTDPTKMTLLADEPALKQWALQVNL